MSTAPNPPELPAIVPPPSARDVRATAGRISAPVRETRRETRVRLRAEDDARPGLGQQIRTAFQLESSFGAISRFADRRRYTEIDPTWPGVFGLDRQEQEAFLSGLPEHYFDTLLDTNSREHATVIADQLRMRAQREQQLAEAGMSGMALRMGAAMFDPGNILVGIGATLALGPVGTGGAVLNRAQRLRRAAQVGTAAGGTNLLIDSIVYSDDPDHSVNDLILSGAFGFAVGGGGSLAFQTVRSQMARRLARRITDDELSSVIQREGVAVFGDSSVSATGSVSASPRVSVRGFTLEDDLIEQHFRRQQHADEISKVPDDLSEVPVSYTGIRYERVPGTDPAEWVNNIDAEDLGGLYWQISNELNGFTAPSMSPRDDMPLSAMGAAAARGMEFVPEDLRGTDFNITGLINDAPSRWSGVRPGISGQGGDKSLPSEVRAAMNALVRDAVKKKDTQQVISGIEHKNMVESRLIGVMMGEWLPAFKQWARAGNASKIAPAGINVSGQARFGSLVTRAIREGGSTDPHVDRASKAVGQAIESAHEFAVRHGVPGAADIKPGPDYIPRAWSAPKIRAAIVQHGELQVQQAVATSLQRGWLRELSDDDALMYAKMMLRVAMNPDRYNAFDQARLINGRGDMDFIVSVIRQEVGEGETANNLINALRARKISDGKPPPLQNRTTMDELYEVQLDTGTLRIDDLFNNHAGELVSSYVRSMVGAGVRQRVLEAVGDFAGREFVSVEDMLSDLSARMAADNLPARQITATMNRLKVITDIMENRRTTGALDLGKEYDKVFRALRDIQQAMLGGTFGFAQLPETGMAAAQMGIRNMIRQIPSFGRFIELSRTGRTTGLASTMATMTGKMGNVGNPIFSRASDLDPERPLSRLERITRPAARLSFLASLQSQIMDIQIAWTQAAGAQKIAGLARSGKSLGKARMEQLGWTPEMAERIARELKETAVWSRHGVLEDIDISRWQDNEALAHFSGGMRRWSTAAIQQDTLGAMMPFMQTETGKTIIQFRSFVFGAYENHLLNGAAMAKDGDFSDVFGWGLATFIAANAYVAQQVISNAGRSDYAEIMAERLSEQAIITAAVQRAGFSSFLPDIANSAWAITGGSEPIFGARNTGLPTFENILSNPTTDMIAAMTRTTSAASKSAFRGEDFDTDDVRRAMRLLPFHRLPYIQAILDSGVEAIAP